MNYSQSAQLLERAKKSLAGGVASEFRKYNHPHAIFYSHGLGNKIYDVDGNEYLDYTLSQGPLLLGHNHPHVVKRVDDYAKFNRENRCKKEALVAHDLINDRFFLPY